MTIPEQAADAVASTNVSDVVSGSHESHLTSAPENRRALDRSLTRGVAWMGSVKWLTQLLTWLSTIFVARILSPSDYGLVGLSSMYMGFVTLLSEFGIGSTVIQMRTLSDSEVAQINTLSLLFGLVSFVVSCLAAPLLAAFFNAPQLTWVVIAMASVFVITSSRVVPQALLQRDLRFRDLAINEGVQSLLLAAGTITCALLGFRYWTLVIANVLGALVSTIGVLRLVRVRHEWPQWRSLGPALQFSRHTIMGRIAWYVYSNADFFIAGKVLGKDALGAYRFGWDLADSPVQKLTAMVQRVTPSILSAVQKDKAAMRRYLLRISETVALATFPATIGLALVARDLVALVLGDKWLVMVEPLQVLAGVAALRSIAPIFPQILTASRKNHVAMRVSVAAAIIMPPAFYIGSRWGVHGIAMVWLLVYPLVVILPVSVIASREVGLSLGELLRGLSAPISSTCVMALAVIVTRLAWPPDHGRVSILAAQVAAGAIAYVAALALMHRERVRVIVTKIRESFA